MLLNHFIDNESFIESHVGAAKKANTSTMAICALDINSAKRKDTEQFIQKGYLKTYQANISVTTPYLISLKKGALKSALGIRSAEDVLFTEQYIGQGIENVLASSGVVTSRKKIAEIAHLYSNAKVFTLPLMLVTAVALMHKGFSTMVFTGTTHVINLINKTGIHVQVLKDADPSQLDQSEDQWGTYYDSKPKVAFIALQDVLKIITLSPKLSTMFDQLSGQIANVVLQLESL